MDERFLVMSDKKDSKPSTTPDVVQRGDDVQYESRDGGDRRGGDRGLNPGRRLIDHHRARSQFNERIETLTQKGYSPDTIAQILNDEHFPTAAGGLWTTQAIVQLLESLKTRKARDAWLPASLEIGENADDE